MDLYGVRETNPLPDGFHDEPIAFGVDWTDPLLAKIERLRLLSDPGFPFWDVSYCDGRLKDGTKVSVSVPFSGPGMLPKRALHKTIIAWAKRDGVFAKGLGIFDAISTLNLKEHGMKLGNFDVHAGDRVTIKTPHGSVAGKVNSLLMFPGSHVVIDLGGKHGRPAVADAGNIISVKPAPLSRAYIQEFGSDREG